MRSFEHKSAASFSEAAEMLREKGNGRQVVIAGGTDLVGGMKKAILKDAPQTVIDLKTIPDTAYINKDEKVCIGALTKLAKLAESEDVPRALSQAAKSVATPVIRNVATIGGNICQDVRCWYYRYPHEVGDRFDCARKGGNTCYAIQGENRYHSVFGGMKVHTSACTKNCPAGTDISAYMEKIRKGDWDGAAETIMRVNPLPMCTSRVCPHPCQDGCNQNVYGDPVSIHCVERTLGDYILAHKEKFYKKPEAETGKKVAVVGAGPSGLTAAYFLRKQGHDVTVIDTHEKAGGVLQYGIPHYRLPKTIVDEVSDALAGMGIKFRLSATIGKDISMDTIVKEHDSVFLGTGAWKQPILGISGENLTEFGLNFLVEVNTFLKNAINDEVLVCGGGNVAMDVALTAKRLGAKNVRLVCLEQKNEMPASAEEIARAEEEGVEIINGWGLKGIVSDDNGKASGLQSMRCVSVFDENGRFSPVYDDKDVRIIKAKTIILATGQKVDISFIGEKYEKQLKSERGLFAVDKDTFQTRNDKIFAGGDAATGPNIAIRAINAGRCAAASMSAKLGAPIVHNESPRGFLTLDADGITEKSGAKLKERPVDARTLTDEDAASLNMAEAEKEASRCMNCGCYSVNASDISPVLVALDGEIVTNKKTIPAADFFTTKLKATDMLDQDEIVAEVKVPAMEDYTTGYEKLRVRESVDFALVSLAYAYKMDENKIADIRLTYGGAAPVPVRITAVEEYLRGKTVNEEVTAKAAEIAVKDTLCLEKNTYKIQQMKALLEKVLKAI